MRTLRTVAEVREALRGARAVGLVPTMGAFHDGHLALFAAARAENDVVAASLFVNPAQFGPGEDFDRYPRDEQRDERLAEEAGVDLLFTPSVDELYPEGYQTWVDVEDLARGLEGEFRPGHFRGVATVSQSPRAIGPVSSKPFSIVRRMSGTSASGGAPAASRSEPAARRSVTR